MSYWESQGNMGFSAQTAYPVTQTWIKDIGWMDGFIYFGAVCGSEVRVGH